MSKSKHRNKYSAYEEIRKPTPKPGFAFKDKRRLLLDDIDDDEWLEDVDHKTIKRLKNG